jgi:hypothetical protein
VGTLGRTFVSSASGFVVDALGGNWPLFFVITALMVIPSLVLLVYVGRLLRQRIAFWDEEKAAAAAAPMAPANAAEDAAPPSKGRPAHA